MLRIKTLQISFFFFFSSLCAIEVLYIPYINISVLMCIHIFLRKEITMHTLATIPKDGKLHAYAGYTGIKIRYLKQSSARNDWSFYIYYRTGGRKGKQFLLKVGTKSQGMTAKKADKIRMRKIIESEQHFHEKKNALPIAAIWKEYEKQKKAISSFASVKHCYQYLKPFYAKTPLHISTRDIARFRQQLENHQTKHGKKLSPQTIAHILKLLRTLINFAVKNELSPKNPKLYFDIPKVQNTVNEYLSEKQLKQYINILQEEHSLHVKAFLMTALYTGMRKKALYHLRWQDIDTKHNLIYLQAQTAKKRQSDYIPLPYPVKQILAKLAKFSENMRLLRQNQSAELTEHAKQRLLPQPRQQEQEYIFLDKNKKPYADYFQKAKEIKETIGLPKNYRPLYMLRHNFASLLANSGASLYTIQKLLTHNSPLMTQRYAHLNDKSLQQSSKTVSKFLQKFFEE